MTNLFPNYQRYQIELVSGEETTVFDAEGKAYLDFTSGIAVCNLGHVPKLVKQAVETQLNKIWHTSNLFENKLDEQVAAKIVQERPYDVFFCNSGTEANEAAIKLARKFSNKEKIISFSKSFHGRTFGSMSATAQPKIWAGFGKLVPGFEYLPYNDSAALLQIDEETAAVMVEIIQGEGGVNMADESWLKALQAKCEETGALLIVDEVQTGIGRTGTLYAFEQFGIEPDIFTLAKGLANGIPIGAMVGKKELAIAFGPGSHGSTFGGNKLALAAANQVLTEVSDSAFLAEVMEKSAIFKLQLERNLQAISEAEVRGTGFLIGIELKEPVEPIIEACQKKGLLLLSAGPNVIRLLPPLNVREEDLATALQILTTVIVEKSTVKEG